jgi:predicted RNase H-like HicB family nuclease
MVNRENEQRRNGPAYIVIEQCHDTNINVDFVPGLPGAHSQVETVEEL